MPIWALIALGLALLVGASAAVLRRLQDAGGLSVPHPDTNWEVRLLAAAGRDAAIQLDQEGRVTFWSDSAERMFGYGRDEILGRDPHPLLLPERFRGICTAGLPEFRTSGQGPVVARTVEAVALHKNGTELPVEITPSVVQVDGRWHVAATIRDLSDRIQSEEALRRAKERAEDMAAELTGVNTMLEQTTVWAKEMAAQAAMSNAAKSDFLASMSHEIRTPMNGVLGMLTLLEQTPLNAEQLDCVQTIRYSGEVLLEIINQILDFSRVESGRIDLEEREFDLRREVEEVLVLFGERADAKGIELIANVPGCVPCRLVGDPGRLRQILINLIGNALKFTEKGQVSVDVRIAAREGDGRTVQFEVRDTGIGMSPSVLKGLFHPFYQGDGSIRRKFGGTGLGLAISKKLAEAMKGSIEAKSKPGRGTTLRFSVAAKIASSTSPPDPDLELLAGARALVVHRNAAVRGMLSTHLRCWRIAAAEARNCNQATSALASPEGFRFVIADSADPDLERLRQQIESLVPAGRPEPALVLLVPAKDGRPAEPAATAALVTKPVRGSRLRSVLVSILRPEDQVEASLLAIAAAVGPADPPPAATGKILVAEDNMVNQKLARKLLEKLGYTVEVVENGRMALQSAATGAYSAILMDCQMPLMDGYAATCRIRKLPGDAARVPIIALTAGALKGDREKCLDAGMTDFLTKPVKLDELSSALARWCGSTHPLTPLGKRSEWDDRLGD